MVTAENLREKYISLLGSPSHALSASGRANIIGEHTDYHEGFVMPFAIDGAIHFYAAINQKNTFDCYSFEFDEWYHTDDHASPGSWQIFVHVLLITLKERFDVDPKLSIAFGGNLPMGAGVSSSSALCCGLIELIDKIYALNLSTLEKVLWSSAIEHGTGVQGGLMDQYAIYHGKPYVAMLLDCRTMTHEDLLLPEGWKFMLLHSGVKHNLALTAYNQRRKESEHALSILSPAYAGVTTLRDVTMDQLMTHFEPDDIVFRRVRHVIEENARVHALKKCLLNNEMEAAGRLLNESHSSLRDLYEVSCAELDFLQHAALNSDFILGSRMMGGGFGGCTLNLYRDLDETGLMQIKQDFLGEFGHTPEHYFIYPSQGITFHE
ncbi:MAG: galactokinase [Saprospiraceae bacterium]|nr:galactokinase [Saprospiraceae bacterium]